MHIHLLAIGHKLPTWVDTACEDYCRRLPRELRLNRVLLPSVKRGKNPDLPRVMQQEADKLRSAVPANCKQIVLDVQGRRVSTQQLADMLGQWMHSGQDVALMIGGPDGIAPDLLEQAQLKLSLSDLTFPHTLVHIMIVEQLYRAWSVLNNHPYHRD